MKKAVVIAVISILLLGFSSGCIFPSENSSPVASLSASATHINVNEKVTLSANDSADKDGRIVRYFWDFGDGVNATGKYVSHDYENGGDYTVILIVTDDRNGKALQTITIHVNELPVPDINISRPAYIHETVNFWANDSYDPDGIITDYLWDFGDGTNATGLNASHVYTTKKSFKVTLTVTDDSGAKAATSLEFDIQFRKYNVKWSMERDVFDFASDGKTYEIEDPLERGEVEHLPVNIIQLNITYIIFNLTWIDDYPLAGNPPQPNDEFIMNITSPNGEMYGGEPSTSEHIKVTIDDINKKPDDLKEVPAESPEILEKQLAKGNTSTNGTGDWAVDITITEAGGPNPFDPGIPRHEDGDTGNDWHLEVVYFRYFPVITRL